MRQKNGVGNHFAARGGLVSFALPAPCSHALIHMCSNLHGLDYVLDSPTSNWYTCTNGGVVVAVN